MRRTTTWALLTALAATTGCRPDPGNPTYRNADDFKDQGTGDPEPVVGEDPYKPGEARLALGAFYEGQSSEQVIIDNVATHFYVYGLEADGSPTFTISPDTSIVEEGLQSDRISHGGTPWWGGGIQWDDARNLSNWTTVWLSLRSDSPVFALVQLHIIGGGQTGIVETADYGYVNDGQWHHIAIPLEDFEGVDFTNITAPFVMIGGGGDEGERIYVDNVYYSQD